MSPRWPSACRGQPSPTDKGNNVYAGSIAVKLGPMAVTFEGEATITHDRANRSALIDGRGVDRKGGSRGQVKVTYTLSPTGPVGTNVVIDADVTLAGPPLSSAGPASSTRCPNA